MKTLERLAAIIGRLSNIGGVVSFVAMGSFVILNAVEIAVRSFLNTSLLITDEFSGWLLVWMAFTGMGWTLREGGHIRIDIVTRKFSEKLMTRVNIISYSIGFATVTFFTVFAVRFLIETYTRNVQGVSVIRFPMWYPITGMAFGALVLVFQFLGCLFREIVSLQKSEGGLSKTTN